MQNTLRTSATKTMMNLSDNEKQVLDFIRMSADHFSCMDNMMTAVKTNNRNISVNSILLLVKAELSGFSFSELSNALGLSEQTLKKSIQGKRIFKVGEVKKLIEVLKMSADEVNNIFFGQYEPKQYEIVYYPLSEHIGGALTENTNGTYLIVVNDTLDDVQQHLSLGHELAHLFLNHLTSFRTKAEIEGQADKYAAVFYKLWNEGKLQ